MADLANDITEAKTKLEANKRAEAKTNAKNDERALRLLLDVWRAKKHPRIASLIDRVSDHLRDARGPLKAKSVKERTEKWIALAKKKDPADVGTLLATPWPGTWKDAMPLLEPLSKFPADPRIAVALARIVEDGPFDTWTSYRFYQPLLRIVAKALDLRTLPILEVDLTRERSSYWRRSTRTEVTKTIALLKNAYPKGEPPALTKAEEAALAMTESLFAGEMSAEKDRERGESDFLKAIYEDPKDDAARTVYADWLTEKGDPRGEFISLQLARHEGRSTAESRKKELTLLRKHGKAWVGELDRMLDKEHRVFRRGFFAEGGLTFCASEDEPLPKELSHPAWATAERLSLNWRIDEDAFPKLMALPTMRFVKAFRNVDESTITRILAKDETTTFPTIEELGISLNYLDEERLAEQLEERKRIGNGSAFPNVKRLLLSSHSIENIRWLLESPMAKRLESLSYEDSDLPLGPLLRAIDEAKLKLKEVEVTYRDTWRLTMRRDPTGELSRLVGAPVHLDAGDHRMPAAYSLATALATLDDGDLTELTIERMGELTCNYGEDDLVMLERELARQKRLGTIEVPWIRVKPGARSGGASTTETTKKRSTAFVAVSIEAANPINAKKLEEVLALTQNPPLSLALDAFAVNYGAHTPLDADKDKALEQLTKAIERKRTTDLKIYQTGTTDTAKINVRKSHLELVAPPPKGTDHVGVFLGLIGELFEILGRIESASMPFVTSGKGRRYDLGSVMPFNVLLHWMWMLDPKVDALLPFDSLVELPKRKGLEWLRVERSRDAVLLFFGPTPNKIPAQEQTRAFELACADLMWKTFAKTRGFLPHELFMKVVGAPLKKAGFTVVEPDPKDSDDVLRAKLGRLQLRRANEKTGAQAIFFEPALHLEKEMRLEIEARKNMKKHTADLDNPREVDDSERLRSKSGGYQFIKDEKQAMAAFEHIAKQLPKTLAWFAEPVAK